MAKKRANGEGSIRKKPNGRWEGRYTLGIDPATGRAIQKSVSAKTRAECREKLDRAIRDNRGIPMDHNEDYTVAEWCRLWFETYSKPVIRPNTAKNYRNIIENHIVPAIGMVKLKRLTAIQIQQMYNNSKAKGRVQRFDTQTNATLSGSTVRRIHMVLSSALKQAVKERIIPYNPCDNCRIPPKEKKEMTIIPPEKLGVYLSEAEKYGVLPMFYLELSSGLRRGELLALRWDDLNVKDRILSVSKQVTRIAGELVVTEPKTKNSVRKVALSQQAVALLAREHEQHPDSPILFPSPRTGGYWSPDAVSRINRKLLAKAGIEEHVRFHDLRHPYVKHTTKIFSLRLMDFQAQAYPDARRKTRGACQLHQGGQSQSPVRPLCNRKRFSCLPPQSKMSWILYAISMRLSGYTSTRSISSSASSVVSVSASKIALDASLRLSCRTCSSCFCFACANTAA
mgnify:FL=1